MAILVANGYFSWGIEASENQHKRKLSNDQFDKVILGNENKVILRDINISIEKGDLVMILGPVGSGKSSLLQSILNNMLVLDEEKVHKTKISINGSISYVSQIPWIQNNTVRNNILFFKNMDQDSYQKTINLCELTQDFVSLIGGDQTEIGEKGINLSGGQKARLSIARAIYADKDIYLFDDPLSALDVHVGEKIMKNCIIDHLKGKTRLLVTHSLNFLDVSDKIIIMKNGEISWQGNYELFKTDNLYSVYLNSLHQKNEKPNEISINQEESSNTDKTVIKEDKYLNLIITVMM